MHGTTRQMKAMLPSVAGLAFADFVAAGLKAMARDPLDRAASFAHEDPSAQALLTPVA